MFTKFPQNFHLIHKQYEKITLNKRNPNQFSLEIKDGIQSGIILKNQCIFKDHRKQQQIKMKYGIHKMKQVLSMKNNLIIKRNKYCIQRKFKLECKLLQNKIIGGGCGGSKFQIDNLQKIESKQQKLQKFNKKFIEDHIFYTNKKEICENIEAGQFGPMQLEIFQFLFSFDASIRVDICLYKPKLIEIIDIYLIYLLTGSSEKEILKQSEIDKLGSQIKELKKSFDMESNEQPCLELSFYFGILDQFNSNRVGKDVQNKSSFVKVTEFISKIVKLGVNVGQVVSGDIMSAIKLALQGTEFVLESYKKSKANQLFSYLLDIWRKKSIEFEDKIWQLTLEQELEFYIKLLYEQCSQKDLENDLILLTLIKIDYFFTIALEEEKNREMAAKKFPLDNTLIMKILPFLMQKGDSQNFQEFLSFSVQNPTYRFLALSILLKYYQIISILNDFIDKKEYILVYLSYKYLCEKKKSVKLAYETNKQFVQTFNSKIEDEQFKEKILDISKKRRQDLSSIPSLEISEDKIENINDIERLVANILIDQWERNVKKRQKENIAQKDDVLLEVKDLYIQQQLTFLIGNLKFEDILPQKLSSTQTDEKQIEIQQTNALQIMTEKFLSDNFSKQDIQDEQKKNNQEQFSCRILGILAEGGTGKSMLIKKLESYLIENSNSKNSNSENNDYIPLLIKCNSLDPINPSIEQYLIQQGIEQKQIDSLKNSTRNKVILLDGYDEYTGEYFRIYKKLNLESWKNTKIIVTSRREKLQLNEACFNFSMDNQNRQRDESSFCILKLEEFKQKDILDYCERYFTQYRTNKDKQFDEASYLKDLAVIKDFMQNNQQLENLLYLPINLYLFTRMIVELKAESEIQSIKTSITDQISIQEIFFKEQFKREAQVFVQTSIDSGKKNQEILDEILNTYFEYFQEAAMKMFLNKGKKGIVNFLQIQKDKIEFCLRKDFEKKLSQKQQKTLLDQIVNYVNSKIITRIKDESSFEQKNQINNTSMIEFKHKSLFEYFVARAMKYDFDIHGNSIYNLPIEKLKDFKINQKSIMNIGENQSEQQILIKLYKLLKKEIECEEFRSNYHQNHIEKNNKYIQYLKRSQIQRNTEISQIDIGSSNLISSLFVSKFSYSKLNLNLCSFSQAYICNPKSHEINFDRCNFQHAYLKNSCINFDSCNTQSANFDAYAKVFDTSNIYSFNQVVWGKNDLLIGISESGFINSFKIINQSIQLYQSKQLSQTSLSNILYLNDDNLLVSSYYTLFLINSNTFEIKQIHKFSQKILSITLIEQNILVNIQNEGILKGTFENGFQSLNITGKSVYNKANQILITWNDKEFSLWNTKKNFEIIKTIQDQTDNINSVALSADGKYMATGSKNKIVKIWNAEKDFELINSIQGHASAIQSIAFSSDGKYIATGSWDKTCKIWNAEKGFELINTTQGHSSSVIFVAFSADGKYLATVSSGACKIWNAEKSFDLINTVQGHASTVISVAFSANGKYLATGSADKTCKIWNTEKSFELINTIQTLSSAFISVVFSADGKYLATGSEDNTCKIWNGEKGFELINTIQGHSSSVNSVAFSANVKFLATGSGDKTCKVWNIEKGFELINTIQDHIREINSVAFSADNNYLATGSFDRTCKIWNAEKGFQIIITIQDSDSVQSVAFSPDGKFLATGCKNRICKIFNAEKGFELINTISGHSSTIQSVAFSADGRYLSTGSEDNTCKLWNAEKGFELINTIQGHSSAICSVAFSADGKYQATGSDDKTFKIWNVEKGFELINTIQGHTSYVNSIAFSANGKYLVTGSSDNTCKIWNAEKGFELIKTIQNQTYQIETVAFSADGKYLATGSEDSTCKIWNAEKGFELISKIKVHQSSIISVAFSVDGMYLAIGSVSKTLNIWNVKKELVISNTIKGHTDYINSVAFSPDGKYLATGSKDKTCRIWNAQKGFELINTIQDDVLNSVAFSANGKYLATCSMDKTCKIWNAEKQFQLINTILGHSFTIYSVAFSPGGKYFATGSQDKTCKIWNVEKDFQLIHTIQGHTDRIMSAVFSADGKFLVTGSYDKTCKVWNAENGFELINTDIKNEKLNLFESLYSL